MIQSARDVIPKRGTAPLSVCARPARQSPAEFCRWNSYDEFPRYASVECIPLRSSREARIARDVPTALTGGSCQWDGLRVGVEPTSKADETSDSHTGV